MDDSNPRAVTAWAHLPSLTPRENPTLRTCEGQQQGMATLTAPVTPGLEVSPSSPTLADDDALPPGSPSTETTVSDDRVLPVHFTTSLHGWMHAVNGPRSPLQQPNLTREFEAFREEIRAELQAQAQRIEGFVASSNKAGEVVVSERTYFSAQVSTLRAEYAFSLQAHRESYESKLDALRTDLDNRIGAAQSTLTSKLDHQVMQEVPRLLDKCLSHICTELAGPFDEAACKSAMRQRLERRTVRDNLLPLPVAMDNEENVAEEELPVTSSASFSQGASTLGMAVPEEYEAIDETTAVPADLFESLAMAGRVARNRGQHCRTRCGGKQRLIAAELCLNDGSEFAQPTCTAT